MAGRRPRWLGQAEQDERAERVRGVADLIGQLLDPPGIAALTAALQNPADRAALIQVLAAQTEDHFS